MRRSICAILIVLAWSLAACAAPAPQGPAIWRIHDADSEIWLFGSVHVLPRDLKWRTPQIDAAFANADEVVMETDAASPEAQRSVAALAQRFGALPAGRTLDDLLDPGERAQLAKAASAAHVDPASLQQLRPWFAALKLSVFYAVAHGEDPNAGVEQVLFAEAQAHNKPIGYLETPEVQVRVLADLSPADEKRYFDSTLADIEQGADDLDALGAAWARGDTQAMSRLLEPDLHEAGPALYDALITRRNAHWADEIQHRLAGAGHVFIMVGAAHLVGPDSVVALLRARGVQVEGP